MCYFRLTAKREATGCALRMLPAKPFGAKEARWLRGFGWEGAAKKSELVTWCCAPSPRGKQRAVMATDSEWKALKERTRAAGQSAGYSHLRDRPRRDRGFSRSMTAAIARITKSFARLHTPEIVNTRPSRSEKNRADLKSLYISGVLQDTGQALGRHLRGRVRQIVRQFQWWVCRHSRGAKGIRCAAYFRATGY